MNEKEGIIKNITLVNNNGSDKKVLDLECGKEILFIEFQGRMIKKLSNLKVGDYVSVKFWYNGKISKLSRRYNNLIAKSIRLI